MSQKLFFFDLETTGVNHWQHGIHQISGAIEIDGKVEDWFNFKVAPNPKAKIEAEALAVGNVTVEQIQAYPPMTDVYKELIELLTKYCNKYDKKDKMYLVGYNNASFDNNFLRAFFIQNNDQYFGSWFWSNPIDVFILATMKLMDKRTQMQDFKLRTVAEAFGLPVMHEKLHDALYDIELTRNIYYECK